MRVTLSTGKVNDIDKDYLWPEGQKSVDHWHHSKVGMETSRSCGLDADGLPRYDNRRVRSRASIRLCPFPHPQLLLQTDTCSWSVPCITSRMVMQWKFEWQHIQASIRQKSVRPPQSWGTVVSIVRQIGCQENRGHGQPRRLQKLVSSRRARPVECHAQLLQSSRQPWCAKLPFRACCIGDGSDWAGTQTCTSIHPWSDSTLARYKHEAGSIPIQIELPNLK